MVQRDLDDSPITVRQVRWWWRVHLAVPDAEPLDVFYLAQRFVLREILHEILGAPLEMDDLEAHLAYKPWAGEWNRYYYHRDIEEGRIRPLRDNSDYTEPSNSANLSEEQRRRLRVNLLTGYAEFLGPDLIYTQWATKWLETTF